MDQSECFFFLINDILKEGCNFTIFDMEFQQLQCLFYLTFLDAESSVSDRYRGVGMWHQGPGVDWPEHWIIEFMKQFCCSKIKKEWKNK